MDKQERERTQDTLIMLALRDDVNSLTQQLQEAMENYAQLEKALADGIAQRAADKLHQGSMEALVGEFAGDVEKIERLQQELEQARGELSEASNECSKLKRQIVIEKKAVDYQKARADKAETIVKEMRKEFRAYEVVATKNAVDLVKAEAKLAEVVNQWQKEIRQATQLADHYKKALEWIGQKECERFTGKGCSTFEHCINDHISHWCAPCYARKFLQSNMIKQVELKGCDMITQEDLGFHPARAEEHRKILKDAIASYEKEFAQALRRLEMMKSNIQASTKRLAVVELFIKTEQESKCAICGGSGLEPCPDDCEFKTRVSCDNKSGECPDGSNF